MYATSHLHSLSPLSMANSLIQLSCLILLLLHFQGSVGKNATPPSSLDLIRSSCIHASYPDVCVRTLSAYPDPPDNPRELVKAAVDVSLSHAKKLSKFLKEQKVKKKREKTALNDCMEQVTDSMDELKKSLSELEHLKKRSFEFQMSNLETWVSAALSDDETCLDGLTEAAGKKNGKGRFKEVRKKVVGVAKVTSNALYLISQLGSKQS